MAVGQKISTDHVRGVFADSCLHCHGGGFTDSSFDLTTRLGSLKGSDYGELGIVPGDAEASWLYQLITHQQEPAMPQEASELKPEEIAHVAPWINSGAPYDEPLTAGPDSTPWTERQVSEEAKHYWAFQPLQNATPPEIVDQSWVRGPVDRFIWARCDEAQIEHIARWRDSGQAEVGTPQHGSPLTLLLRDRSAGASVRVELLPLDSTRNVSCQPSANPGVSGARGPVMHDHRVRGSELLQNRHELASTSRRDSRQANDVALSS